MPIAKKTTKADVIRQARESASKLGCDPDLLELMALRIWDAAIETSVTTLRRQLHQFENDGVLTLKILRANLSVQCLVEYLPNDVRDTVMHLADSVIDMPRITLNTAIDRIRDLR